jgi:uncharacterized membrane protein
VSETHATIAEKETSRVEAFSDGVFAIAITLLILEIKVPAAEHTATHGASCSARSRGCGLVRRFAASFFVILIMWVNHHEFLRLVRKVDYPFLFANGGVLLVVTFVPFPTAVLAEHLGMEGARAAAALYCGTFFFWRASRTTRCSPGDEGPEAREHE